MAKSSLKTFLAGKNKLVLPFLKGSTRLAKAAKGVTDQDDSIYVGSFPYNEIWFIDVLDDGTAITYCRN